MAAAIAAVSRGFSTSAYGLRVAPEGDGGIRRPTKTEVLNERCSHLSTAELQQGLDRDSGLHVLNVQTDQFLPAS